MSFEEFIKKYYYNNDFLVGFRGCGKDIFTAYLNYLEDNS